MRGLPLLIPMLLAGCASTGPHPLRPLEIATAPYAGIATTHWTGSLAYERGCLLFYDDSRRVVLAPVWPDGTIFNGTSVMFHKPGRTDQPIVLNEEFVLSGQPLAWSGVPGPRATVFERQCGGLPFRVADVRPAN